MEFFGALWNTVLALAPSLFLGFIIAGILHVFIKQDKILAHLGRPGIGSSAKASLLGVPLPLCSCGVLPVALGLKRDGASKGAVTSFLISTPQTGVDSIAVTWGVLGWPVALAKVVTAFVAGVIGGTAADFTRKNGKEQPKAPACAEAETGPVPARMWRYVFETIFRDIYRWLALGIIISALITTFLEPGQLSQYPLLGGPLGLLAALAVGIPLYVCSISSVPIAAGLIYAGFPVGSALVFLMAGPATNAATMGAVKKALGKRVFIIYILTVIFVSLGAGLLLNRLDITIPGMHHAAHGAGGLARITGLATGFLLVAGILFHGIRDTARFFGKRLGKGGCPEMKLEVRGMSCSNCEARVTSALRKVPGIARAYASVKDEMVRIRTDCSSGPERSTIVDTITGLGYETGEWK